MSFNNWAYKWYGFWRVDASDLNDHFPVFESKIDAEWAPPDIDKLVQYLKAAPVLVPCYSTSAGGVVCHVCGMVIGDCGNVLSDDEWVWTGWLWHEVSAHSIRLPDSLVNFIREKGYRTPSCLTKTVEELPYPKFKVSQPDDNDRYYWSCIEVVETDENT